MSDRAVSRMIKRLAANAGLDPQVFSGHSARSGLATSAALKGASLERIMRQTRHRRTETVLGYIRKANEFKDNVSEDVLS